jgi:hypothetical protein
VVFGLPRSSDFPQDFALAAEIYLALVQSTSCAPLLPHNPSVT